MSEAHCDDPANALLPWYLNGSLQAERAATVRAHLASCAICKAELDVLAEVAEAIALHGLPEEAPPATTAPQQAQASGRSPRLAYALAALLALPAILGVYWAYLGFPAGPAQDTRRRGTLTPDGAADPGETAPVLRPVARLDLGAGSRRDDTSRPTLTLSAGVDSVAVFFIAPVSPEARYTVELHGPDDATLARDDRPLVRDPLGRCTYTFPAALLGPPGEHGLIVREASPDEEERIYRYPFLLEPAPGAR